jgi:hypothetical protein
LEAIGSLQAWNNFTFNSKVMTTKRKMEKNRNEKIVFFLQTTICNIDNFPTL